MRRLTFLCALIIMCCYSLSIGQAITGRVISSSSSPIADAAVSLTVRGVAVRTNTSGQFALDLSSTLPQALKRGIRSNMYYNGRSFVITVTAPQQIAIEQYALNGKKIRTVADKTFGIGTHEVPLAPGKIAEGISIIWITRGGDRYSLIFAHTGPFHSVIAGSGAAAAARKLAVSPATVGGEALVVSKTGYNPRSLDITSYATQNLGDIVLLTVAEDSAAIESKVDSLLAFMSNAQKAGQMVQVINSLVSPDDVRNYGFGSVFNGGEEPVSPNTPANWATRLNALQDGALASTLKIPMIYGLDAVHGNGKVVGSTIFPHNIGLGCTGDSALVERVGRITAYECRALGIHLTFAPCVSVVRDERWGRTYEGFGETPEINSRMGAAITRGLQGD
ncbi:MAG: hypothetical protein JW768_16675, partial [Chitinispirillaceae bacterium]|nr:hypothetical protein [Chitinispirillaceae bacterium]